MNVRTHWVDGLTDIHVGNQHISRLTHTEVREIMLQVIVFGGKKLREEVRHWLTAKDVETVARFLGGEESEPVLDPSVPKQKDGPEVESPSRVPPND